MSIRKDYALRQCSCFAWLRPGNMPRRDKIELRKDRKDQKCRTGRAVKVRHGVSAFHDCRHCSHPHFGYVTETQISQISFAGFIINYRKYSPKISYLVKLESQNRYSLWLVHTLLCLNKLNNERSHSPFRLSINLLLYFPCVSQAVAASKTTRKCHFCPLGPSNLVSDSTS